MVVSNLFDNINYPELTKINPNDLKKETTQYVINVKDVDIIIAVGDSKNTFSKYGITFFPVYLVKEDNKAIQIGIYEIYSKNLLKHIDEQSVLDIETLSDPLLYSFITTSFLLKNRKIPADFILIPEPEPELVSKPDQQTNTLKHLNIHDRVMDKGKKKENAYAEQILIPEIRKDIFIGKNNFIIPIKLKCETLKIANNLRNSYIEDKHNNWIAKFMMNNYYSIKDNEGDSDCLFATIRDAFESIGQYTTVSKLRAKVSGQATNELYTYYKEKYDIFHDIMLSTRTESIRLKKEHENIRAAIISTIDHAKQLKYRDYGLKIKDKYEQIKLEYEYAKYNIKDVIFIKNNKSLEQLKYFMKTNDFWADQRVINILERILNIKFIIMSKIYYEFNDLNNVLQCGEFIDPIIEGRGEFNPEYYIMVEFSKGNIFKLIDYKKKSIFTFDEIPYDIKKMIVHKCMEKNSGVFSLIPKFINFKAKENVKNTKQYFDDLSTAKIRNLFDEQTVFSFYINSADVTPGKGIGEKISNVNLHEYYKLNNYKDWRKKLSNSWIEPFIYDNHKWSSVEHYYQASKFKKSNPEFYLLFTRDSGTELSLNPNIAIGAGSKSGKYNGKLIRPETVKIDIDFNERSSKEMSRAQLAKFTQNTEFTNILLATKNAKLVHHSRAQEPVISDNLLIVRDTIRNNM